MKLVCFYCGTDNAKLCSGCHKVGYCSVICQRADRMSHNQICYVNEQLPLVLTGHYYDMIIKYLDAKSYMKLHSVSKQMRNKYLRSSVDTQLSLFNLSTNDMFCLLTEEKINQKVRKGTFMHTLYKLTTVDKFADEKFKIGFSVNEDTPECSKLDFYRSVEEEFNNHSMMLLQYSNDISELVNFRTLDRKVIKDATGSLHTSDTVCRLLLGIYPDEFRNIAFTYIKPNCGVRALIFTMGSPVGSESVISSYIDCLGKASVCTDCN